MLPSCQESQKQPVSLAQRTRPSREASVDSSTPKITAFATPRIYTFDYLMLPVVDISHVSVALAYPKRSYNVSSQCFRVGRQVSFGGRRKSG